MASLDDFDAELLEAEEAIRQLEDGFHDFKQWVFSFLVIGDMGDIGDWNNHKKWSAIFFVIPCFFFEVEKL